MTAVPEPKKSIAKKFFIIVGILLSLLGLDSLTFNIVPWGGAVTLTDSTMVVVPLEENPAIDTSASSLDSVSADTSK